MNLPQKFIDWLAKRIKIPPIATQMFRASSEISGIDKKTLPVELIPLNSIQIARGLLNFTVLQSKLNWIFPYWINQQYNPYSISFIPRSHLGLSMNITHRNWTSVGNPDCDIEPIVDPRGLVTPFKNSWSIDVWLMVNDDIFFPSKSETAEQNLIDDIPVVKTKFIFKNLELILITYTYIDKLFHIVNVINKSTSIIPAKIIFSIRPFNPEGISLLNKIEFNEKETCFNLHNSSGRNKIFFNKKPDYVNCSNFKDGDSVSSLFSKQNGKQNFSSICNTGLASSIASFQTSLIPSVSESIEASIPLKENITTPSVDISKVKSCWDNYLNGGTKIKTPNANLNSLLQSSISSLLMLTDKDTITPGPFTYHQFWFRDAAYMIWALDNFGFHSFTKKIIQSYPKYQTKDGYFRSQKGEWDSNGQAIWTVFQHYNITKDSSMISSLFDSLLLGVKWIENKRLTDNSFKNKSYFGLMPVGMSAEHLGLADHYFWDNFWSLAGLNAFKEICMVLGKEKELRFTEQLIAHYKLCIDVSIESVQKRYSLNAIPASPERDIDCGMIGSICASYPLQLFEPDNQKILSTLNALKEKYFVKGLFFQHFIHSGMNPYLTLQIAHSYLFAGKPELFWNILNNTISYASSTNNFPEAIHPATNGGAMGDGHHGWASAEIALALHDAFIYELNNANQNELVLLHGIPKEWFLSYSDFYIAKAPVSDGNINLKVTSKGDEFTIEIEFNRTALSKRKWKLKLPFDSLKVIEGNKYIHTIQKSNCNTVLELIPGSLLLKFEIRQKEQLIPDFKKS